jgi:hypothetical protein
MGPSYLDGALLVEISIALIFGPARFNFVCMKSAGHVPLTFPLALRPRHVRVIKLFRHFVAQHVALVPEL